MKRYTMAIVAIAAIVIALVFQALYLGSVRERISIKKQSPISSLRVGSAAPDFVMRDLSGGEITRSDLQGKKFVLVFWATWHDISTQQLKIIDGYLASQGNPKDIQIYTVNSGEERVVVKNFMARSGLGVPVLLDPDNRAIVAFDANFPSSYFVDGNGRVKVIIKSLLTQAEFAEKVREL